MSYDFAPGAQKNINHTRGSIVYRCGSDVSHMYCDTNKKFEPNIWFKCVTSEAHMRHLSGPDASPVWLVFINMRISRSNKKIVGYTYDVEHRSPDQILIHGKVNGS